MQAFREMVRGWLGKGLLALLSVPFVFVGLESYFGGSSDVTVAEVDGTPIPQSRFDQAVDNQRQQLQARTGGAALTPEQLTQLRERVLNNLVQRELLIKSADKAGYRVSDATIQQQIQSVPNFQEGGKFSPQRYAQMLSQIGETPKSFPERARQEILSGLRVSGWMQSAFVTAPELDMLSSLDAQQRDVSYALIPASRFLPTAAVSDAEIKASYDKDGKRFMRPELVSLSYVTLSRATFLAQAQVTPEAVQARYDERVKALSAGEERKAAHILIATSDKVSDAQARTKIEALARQVAAGGDFAALAKANSQDPGSAVNGGDLGYAGHGMFVPEFEKALFALAKPGDVSAIVKSPFGYHLIKLLDIRKSAVPSLASLRPALEKEVREGQADELYGHAVEKLDAAAYESSDLVEPAKQLQLTVQTTPLFDQKGGEGIAAQRKVVEAAFSDELAKEGKNSSAISLPDGSTVWLHVDRHEPVRKLPLAEVSAVIKSKLQLDKALAMAQAEAEKVVAASKSKPLAEAVAAAGLSLQSQAGLTRRSTLPPALLQDVFHAPAPVAGKVQPVAVKLADAAAVLAVTAVKPGAALQGTQRAVTQSMLVENRAQQELLDVLGYLQSEADVEYTRKKAD